MQITWSFSSHLVDGIGPAKEVADSDEHNGPWRSGPPTQVGSGKLVMRFLKPPGCVWPDGPVNHTAGVMFQEPPEDLGVKQAHRRYQHYTCFRSWRSEPIGKKDQHRLELHN